jgi:hypothetical protein
MKIEVKQKHIDLAPKLFSKGVNAKECCPISCAIQEKFPDKLVSVGWIGSPDYASKMFHECFYISVTDPEDDYEEIIYSDDKIYDLEKCSKFAEQYDNGDKVKPFEFEIEEK